jgi:hypothetical protein
MLAAAGAEHAREVRNRPTTAAERRRECVKRLLAGELGRRRPMATEEVLQALAGMPTDGVAARCATASPRSRGSSTGRSTAWPRTWRSPCGSATDDRRAASHLDQSRRADSPDRGGAGPPTTEHHGMKRKLLRAGFIAIAIAMTLSGAALAA